ncbi:hypothetical protein BCM02_109274 [Paenibacillus methanolicus]|uniref:Uncharacterized protein n=1 Tax=Paenibacillus methanolicus TaxID=582686 RepID=A0A5S5BXV5_9BACL|nr:hypothetical protein BCM02_109274 [Paenibacillus methanolicus]
MKKGIKAIVRGGIDFAEPSSASNEIELLSCGGAPTSSFDVFAIPNLTQVTLVRGTASVKVTVREPEGSFECNYNAFNVSPNVAQKLQLRSGARYLFAYDSVTKIIRILRKPVSTERVLVIPDQTYPANQIGIGDGLKERLGYYLADQVAISVRGGGASKQLRVKTIEPGFDELFRYEIRLNPQNFKLFGLGNQQGAFFVSYDQLNRILRFGRRTVLKKRIVSSKRKK